MDELTKRRLAHNEEVFRAVNEEVSEAHAPGAGGRTAYLCECADRACAERLLLAAAEYLAVRSEPNRFLVAPGHTVPELERVVEHRDGYDVVEKDVRTA